MEIPQPPTALRTRVDYRALIREGLALFILCREVRFEGKSNFSNHVESIESHDQRYRTLSISRSLEANPPVR